MKLDVKDKKILYELSKNARIPSIRLAKQVGVSREVADYRIKKLIEKGIITSFITDIDISKLNCTRYIIYLELQNVDEKKEVQILNRIVSNNLVSWTTTQTGKWNVIFDVIAGNIKEVNAIVQNIQKEYFHKISDYKIASQLEYHHYYSKYFGEETKEKNTSEDYKLDKIDINILTLISNNARMNYVLLSSKLGMSANAIKLRINKLKSTGIIQKFTIQINKQLLGLQAYNLQLTFKDTDPAKAKRFLKYIKNHPNVNFYYFPFGHWDLEIGLFVKNANELRKIILDFRMFYEFDPNFGVDSTGLDALKNELLIATTFSLSDFRFE